jgi:transposase
MVTALATCFSVTTSRNGSALRHLIGSAYRGIVGSDRHRPYLALPPERHQLCWSHLIRNFQALVDRGGLEQRHRHRTNSLRSLLVFHLPTPQPRSPTS